MALIPDGARENPYLRALTLIDNAIGAMSEGPGGLECDASPSQYTRQQQQQQQQQQQHAEYSDAAHLPAEGMPPSKDVLFPLHLSGQEIELPASQESLAAVAAAAVPRNDAEVVADPPSPVNPISPTWRGGSFTLQRSISRELKRIRKSSFGRHVSTTTASEIDDEDVLKRCAVDAESRICALESQLRARSTQIEQHREHLRELKGRAAARQMLPSRAANAESAESLMGTQLSQNLSATATFNNAMPDCALALQHTLKAGGEEMLVRLIDAMTGHVDQAGTLGEKSRRADKGWAEVIAMQSHQLAQLTLQQKRLRADVGVRLRLARNKASPSARSSPGQPGPQDLHELQCLLKIQEGLISEVLEMCLGSLQLESADPLDGVPMHEVDDALAKLHASLEHMTILQRLGGTLLQGECAPENALRLNLVSFDVVTVAEALLMERAQLQHAPAVRNAELSEARVAAELSDMKTLCQTLCERLEHVQNAVAIATSRETERV